MSWLRPAHPEREERMGCAEAGFPLPGVVGRPLLAGSDPPRALQLKLPKEIGVQEGS